MSEQKVYVVRHYSYDYREFESLIGMSDTMEGAAIVARDNEHVWDETIITYSICEHRSYARHETSHVYIELMEVNNAFYDYYRASLNNLSNSCRRLFESLRRSECKRLGRKCNKFDIVVLRLDAYGLMFSACF